MLSGRTSKLGVAVAVMHRRAKLILGVTACCSRTLCAAVALAVAITVLLASHGAIAQTGSHHAPAVIAKKKHKKCRRGYHLVTRKVRRHHRKVRVKVCVRNKPKASVPGSTSPGTSWTSPGTAIPTHRIQAALCTFSFGQSQIQIDAPFMYSVRGQSVAYQPVLYWSNSDAGPWYHSVDAPAHYQPTGASRWYLWDETADGAGTAYFDNMQPPGFYWKVAVHFWWYRTSLPDGHPFASSYEWINSAHYEGDPISIKVTTNSCYY